MENILITASENSGDIMEDNNNLYLVLASDNQQNKNPLIIGILYIIVVMIDKGIISEINNRQFLLSILASHFDLILYT